MNEEAPSALSWWMGPWAPLSCTSALGPVTLYQDVAAAASLALVFMSFLLVPWATLFSGCLGNQPLLLMGEEGPKSGKKKKKVTSFCWQIFEDALKTSTLLSRLRRRFLGASPLLPSAATVASISGRKKCPLNRQDGICCNSHILRQCHGLLCLDREGKKRRGNLQDR